MKHIRLVGAATAAALGIVGLAGCGSGGGSSRIGGAAKSESAAPPSAKAGGTKAGQSLSDTLALVTKSTKGANSARVSMVEKLGSAGSIKASGVTAWNPMAMDITMDMSGIQGAAQSGLDTMKLRMTGNVMYMNMGAQLAKELDGKHWLRMDLSELAKTQGAAGQQLLSRLGNQNGSQDPTQSVGLLTSSGDVKEVGKETLDGVLTTHYSGRLDVAALVAEQGTLKGMTASQREQFQQQMSAAGVKTMAVDLWVNPDNRPVKVHETAQGATGPIDIVLTYSDYGTPVHVQAPPASDTEDYAKVLAKTSS
ncbi:hypothetical protein ACIQGZ_13525 [Streptomyces sp. NPDC092296]|uniref:hypothetical protein n=1 Tax=Streptomyces sp. NPDC092296 TaxID=3366012 RepID=UPI003800943F